MRLREEGEGTGEKGKGVAETPWPGISGTHLKRNGERLKRGQQVELDAQARLLQPLPELSRATARASTRPHINHYTEPEVKEPNSYEYLKRFARVGWGRCPNKNPLGALLIIAFTHRILDFKSRCAEPRGFFKLLGMLSSRSMGGSS